MESMDNFEGKLAGRQMKFRRASLAQMALLHRLAEATKEAEGTDEYTSLARETIEGTFDILESMIVEEADRKFVLRNILRGKIEHSDAMNILSGRTEEAAPEEAAPEKAA